MSSSTAEELFVNTNHSSSVENNLPTLYITSFGHRRGPLIPTPDISVDVRTLPNPPKAIRTGQTGLSMPLREWLFSNEEVLKRFDGICKFIQSRLSEAEMNGETEINVGICCELGRHRSVAVVEELGRTRFNGWNVIVGHRDAHLKRTNQKERSRRQHDGHNDD